MESKLKIFAVLFLFSFCSRSNAKHCSLADLAVTQSLGPRGSFKVVVENRCICTQSNIKVECRGFDSTMHVDQAILRPDGDGNLCTLNDGRAIGMGPEYAFTFYYTSNGTQISFKPVSSTENCS